MTIFVECKKCRTRVPQGTKFCPNCGNAIESNVSNLNNGQQGNNNVYVPKKNSYFVFVLMAIFAVIMVIGLLANAVLPYLEDSRKEKQQEQIQSDLPEDNIATTDNDTSEKEKPKKTNSETKKDYIKSCKEYDYKKVLRNPEDYIGKRIKVKVSVSSVHSESWLNSTKYYFAYSNDEYDMWCGDEYAIIDTREEQDLKILEEDIIEVYGEIAEPEETTSIIVNSTELFSINMKYVKLIKE